jgi:hypothetical protein
VGLARHIPAGRRKIAAGGAAFGKTRRDCSPIAALLFAAIDRGLTFIDSL